MSGRAAGALLLSLAAAAVWAAQIMLVPWLGMDTHMRIGANTSGTQRLRHTMSRTTRHGSTMRAS